MALRGSRFSSILVWSPALELFKADWWTSSRRKSLDRGLFRKDKQCTLNTRSLACRVVKSRQKDVFAHEVECFLIQYFKNEIHFINRTWPEQCYSWDLCLIIQALDIFRKPHWWSALNHGRSINYTLFLFAKLGYCSLDVDPAKYFSRSNQKIL